MRKIFAILALALPLSTFAAVSTVTYKATSSAPANLNSLSFETATLSTDASSIVLSGHGTLSGDFKIVSALLKDETSMSFIAEKVLINKWETGCGEGEIAKAIIKGDYSIATGVEAKALAISVEYTTVVDTCHSRPQVQVINYVLVH